MTTELYFKHVNNYSDKMGYYLKVNNLEKEYTIVKQECFELMIDKFDIKNVIDAFQLSYILWLEPQMSQIAMFKSMEKPKLNLRVIRSKLLNNDTLTDEK